MTQKRKDKKGKKAKVKPKAQRPATAPPTRQAAPGPQPVGALKEGGLV